MLSLCVYYDLYGLNTQNVQFFITKNPLVNCHFSFEHHAIRSIGIPPNWAIFKFLLKCFVKNDPSIWHLFGLL